MTNLNVVMINVASHDDGLRVLDRVESATEAGEITIDDVAMVYKSDNGKVKIPDNRRDRRQGSHQGRRARSARRDLPAPLVPATAVGAGLGAIVAKARDRGISDKLIEQAGRSIESYGAVVFVLADQASTRTITTLIDEKVADGAKVEYEVLAEDAQNLLRETLEMDNP